MSVNWRIPTAIVIAIAVGGLLLFNSQRPSTPVLVFIGYEASPSNASAIAKLELRNTTRKTIWLRYSGTEFPLRPPLLELPAKPTPKLTNGIALNIRLGSFFTHGEKVLPGDSVRLDVPLHSGESPKQVGVSYFSGSFSDSNDFLGHLRVPLLYRRASWKDKALFYWQRFGRKLKAPHRQEIWCPNVLSFQEHASK
jgi:hypothetical protein